MIRRLSILILGRERGDTMNVVIVSPIANPLIVRDEFRYFISETVLALAALQTKVDRIVLIISA